MSCLPAHLEALAKIVDEAGAIALAAQGSKEFEIKPDGSIVTPADKASERFLREALKDIVPGATFWGEELGREPEAREGLWLVDPIDGTSNFAFGSPLWGVSVGFFKDSKPKWGAICMPALGETYVADVEIGAFCNGVSMPLLPPGGVKPFELLSYPDRVEKALPNFRFPGKMRHQGAVVVDAIFACRQRFRALIGLNERLYDIAGVLAIGIALGADIRFADGTPIDYKKYLDGARIEKPWILFPPESGFSVI